MRILAGVLAILILVTVPASAQTVRNVPAQYPTVQAAIAAAVNGDVVLVQPGIYFENLDMMGRRVKLRSAAGAAQTILDGSQVDTVIRYSGSETGTSTIEGFTIRNGRGASAITYLDPTRAGGIHVPGGVSLLIRDCVITGNLGGDGYDAAGVAGPGAPGGIWMSSNTRIVDTVVSNNFGGRGGSLIGGPSPLLAITVPGEGGAGGVYCSSSSGSAQLLRCILEFNVGGNGGASTGPAGGGNPERSGGGAGGAFLALNDQGSHLECCILRQNTGGDTFCVGPPGGPGGLKHQAGRLLGCEFHDNQGGVVSSMVSTPGPGGSGAVRVVQTLDMSGCTIVANSAGISTAGSSAGGITAPTTIKVTNSIIRDNFGSHPMAPPNISALPGSFFVITTIDYSNVQGSFAGTGSIDQDPFFVDAANRDYRLQYGSPSIDSGLDAPLLLTDRDLDCWPRVIGIHVDMGAHESHVGLPDLIGSCEDLRLETTVNAAGPLQDTARTVQIGDILVFTLKSPGGVFTSGLPVLMAEPFFGPPFPQSFFGYPEIHVDLGAFAVYDARLTGVALGTGASWMIAVPPIAQGFTVRFQGFIATATAANRIFVATDAVDVIVP